MDYFTLVHFQTKTPVSLWHHFSLLTSTQIRKSKIPNATFFFPSQPLSSFLWDNGILVKKLFRPIVRKNSRDQENLFKFQAEHQEFAEILKSHEHFTCTVKGQNNFSNRMDDLGNLAVA